MTAPPAPPVHHSPAVAASEAAVSPVPRRVVYAGQGLRPASMLVTIGFLLAPGILSPWIILWLLPEAADGDTLGTFLPSLFWLGLALLMIIPTVVTPLLKRRLIQRGDLVEATVTAVEASTTRNVTTYTVHFSYTPRHASTPLTGMEKTRRKLTRAPAVGDVLHAVYDPGNARRVLVVEYADHKPADMVERHPAPVGPLRIAGTLSLLLGSPVMLVASEFGRVHALMMEAGPPFSWLKNLILLGVLAGLAWVARQAGAFQGGARGPDSPLAGVHLWNALLLVSFGFASFSGMLLANRRLPSEERQLNLVVQAQFCLSIHNHGDICALEFLAPPEVASLRLVRGTLGPERAPLSGKRLGSAVALTWHAGALGVPYLDGMPSSVGERGEGSVGGMMVTKGKDVSGAAARHEVAARGWFAAASPALAELQRLGIQVTSLAPVP